MGILFFKRGKGAILKQASTWISALLVLVFVINIFFTQSYIYASDVSVVLDDPEGLSVVTPDEVLFDGLIVEPGKTIRSMMTITNGFEFNLDIAIDIRNYKGSEELLQLVGLRVFTEDAGGFETLYYDGKLLPDDTGDSLPFNLDILAGHGTVDLTFALDFPGKAIGNEYMGAQLDFEVVLIAERNGNPPENGSLTIHKALQDENGQATAFGDKTFTVELTRLDASGAPTADKHTVTLDGQNQSRTVDLPFGNYAVSELNAADYIVTLTGDIADGVVALSEDDATGAVTVTNRQKSGGGDPVDPGDDDDDGVLSVTKVLQDESGQTIAFGDKTFTVELTRLDASGAPTADKYTVTLDQQNQSRNVDLPFGNYVFNELNAADYTVTLTGDIADGVVALSEDDATDAVTVTNRQKSGGGNPEDPDPDDDDGVLAVTKVLQDENGQTIAFGDRTFTVELTRLDVPTADKYTVTLDQQNQSRNVDLPFGDYALQELNAADYTFTLTGDIADGVVTLSEDDATSAVTVTNRQKSDDDGTNPSPSPSPTPTPSDVINSAEIRGGDSSTSQTIPSPTPPLAVPTPNENLVDAISSDAPPEEPVTDIETIPEEVPLSPPEVPAAAEAPETTVAAQKKAIPKTGQAETETWFSLILLFAAAFGFIVVSRKRQKR